MKPKNHEFGVPRWPPQDFRLIETMATSVATYVDQIREAHKTLSTKIVVVVVKLYLKVTR